MGKSDVYLFNFLSLLLVIITVFFISKILPETALIHQMFSEKKITIILYNKSNDSIYVNNIELKPKSKKSFILPFNSKLVVKNNTGEVELFVFEKVYSIKIRDFEVVVNYGNTKKP